MQRNFIDMELWKRVMLDYKVMHCNARFDRCRTDKEESYEKQKVILNVAYTNILTSSVTKPLSHDNSHVDIDTDQEFYQ